MSSADSGGAKRVKQKGRSLLLQDYLRDKVPYLEELTVSNMFGLSDGWECEVYSFTLGFHDKGLPQMRPMILRLYAGQETASLSAKAEREFNILQQLGAEGYPVPEVYLLECDSKHFGVPFVIMERIEGEVLSKLYDCVSQAECEKLLVKMCQLLVRLHQLDWRCFTDQALEAATAVKRELERSKAMAASVQADYALPALTWLETQACHYNVGELALAHGDYHAANIIVDQEGHAAVIDWAGAYVTDYRFDLAWSLLFLPETIGAKFVDLYRQLSGRPVLDLDFFRACAILRRIVTMVVSLEQGPEILGMRPGAEARIRQQTPHLRVLYEQWVALSGVRIEHVERVMATLEGGKTCGQN